MVRQTPDPSGTPHPAPRNQAESLALTVGALREEIRGLRASAQLRAVIEQAKGVLVERHGYSLEDAFAHLRALSQEHNVRLVEVAATIVGVALPNGEVADSEADLALSKLGPSSAVSPAWQTISSEPDVRAGVAAALVDSLASAADEGGQGAQLLADLLASEGVSAVTLYRPAADGSLRLVGQAGMPGDLISSWQSIPPTPEIPYVRALNDGRPRFWSDHRAMVDDFPALSATPSSSEATALIPISDTSAPIGVVGLLWAGREDFDDERRASIIATVSRVAPALLRHVAPADPELEWLNTVLRLQLDPWLLLDAVRGSDAVVRDFVVQEAAAGVPEAEPWLGRRLLEVWPFLAEDGTFVAMAGLMRSGGSWTTLMDFSSDAPWGHRGTQVRAVRLGERLVLVWRSAGTGR